MVGPLGGGPAIPSLGVSEPVALALGFDDLAAVGAFADTSLHHVPQFNAKSPFSSVANWPYYDEYA